jgi:hypothetical protein
MIELLVGPFLGVFGAFALQRLYNWYRDGQSRKKLRKNLRSELEKGLSLLSGQRNLLPTIMWNSTVASGDVKLLSFKDRNQLSSIYFEIENHNYATKRVRDSAVVALTGSHRAGSEILRFNNSSSFRRLFESS